MGERCSDEKVNACLDLATKIRLKLAEYDEVGKPIKDITFPPALWAISFRAAAIKEELLVMLAEKNKETRCPSCPLNKFNDLYIRKLPIFILPDE